MGTLKIRGKEIRVFISARPYEELVRESKSFGLTLAQYSGLKLSGFNIVNAKKVVEQQKTED